MSKYNTPELRNFVLNSEDTILIFKNKQLLLDYFGVSIPETATKSFGSFLNALSKYYTIHKEGRQYSLVKYRAMLNDIVPHGNSKGVQYASAQLLLHDMLDKITSSSEHSWNCKLDGSIASIAYLPYQIHIICNYVSEGYHIFKHDYYMNNRKGVFTLDWVLHSFFNKVSSVLSNNTTTTLSFIKKNNICTVSEGYIVKLPYNSGWVRLPEKDMIILNSIIGFTKAEEEVSKDAKGRKDKKFYHTVVAAYNLYNPDQKKYKIIEEYRKVIYFSMETNYYEQTLGLYDRIFNNLSDSAIENFKKTKEQCSKVLKKIEQECQARVEFWPEMSENSSINKLREGSIIEYEIAMEEIKLLLESWWGEYEDNVA